MTSDQLDRSNFDMPNPATPIYLDLFEDGLYVQASGNKDSKRYAQLLNNLRFHTAIAILFDRPIAVPEPWFTSSAAFLRVAKEVLSAYSPTLHRNRITDRLQPVSFPFVFGLFDSAPTNPVNSYLSALEGRLKNNQQVLLAPPFGKIGAELDAAERRFRDAVVTLIDQTRLAMSGTVDGGHIQTFTLRLGELISSAGYEHDGINIANDLNVLLTALGNEPQSRNPFIRGDMANLSANFARTESAIRRVIDRRGIEDYIDGDILNEYREMFRRTDAGLPGTLVNKYLRYLGAAQLSDESREVIWATGRFALHRAYASISSPQATTISAEFYCSSGSSTVTRNAIHNLIGFVGQNETGAALFNEMGSAPIPSIPYDLADTLPWEIVWRDIYSVATSPSWRKFRESTSNQIRKQRPGSNDLKYWRETFDRINDKIQTIEFGHRSGYRMVVMKRLLEEKDEDIVNACEVAQNALGGAAQADPIFSMGLSGLKLLVGLTNFVGATPYFNAVRAGRETRSWLNRILGRREGE